MVRDALAESSGALTLEVFEPGEIVSTFAITEAVRLDSACGLYLAGRPRSAPPRRPLWGRTPGLSPWAYLAWWYEGREQLARGVYHDQGLHPILCGLIGPETAGWFRKPKYRRRPRGPQNSLRRPRGKTLQARRLRHHDPRSDPSSARKGGH